MHSSFSIIRMLKLYNKIYPLHRTSTKISYCVYNAEIEEYQMKGKYHVSTLRFYMLSVSLVKTRTNLIFSLIKTLKGLFQEMLYTKFDKNLQCEIGEVINFKSVQEIDRQTARRTTLKNTIVKFQALLLYLKYLKFTFLYFADTNCHEN